MVQLIDKKPEKSGFFFYSKKTVGVCFLFSLFLLLSSCDPIEQDIVGVWTIKNAEVYSDFRPDGVSQKPGTQKVQFEFDFHEDGTMVYTDQSGAKLKGKWELIRGEFIETEIFIPLESYVRQGSKQFKTHTSRLKILSCYSDKMSLREDFKSGQSVVYYLTKK